MGKIVLNKRVAFSKSSKLEKEEIRKNYLKSGITLIALIITVLILLILAGVTLSLTLRR